MRSLAVLLLLAGTVSAQGADRTALKARLDAGKPGLGVLVTVARISYEPAVP